MTNKAPLATGPRNKIYEILDGERDYQIETHPSSPPKSLIDYANLLIEYTDKLAADVVHATANPAALSSPTGGPFKRLREIAAIAVAAMEVHGAQPREGHVPASAGVTGTMHVTVKPDSLAPASAPAAPAAPAAGATKPTTVVAHAPHPVEPPIHPASTMPSAPPHTPSHPSQAPIPLREQVAVPHTTEHPGPEKK